MEKYKYLLALFITVSVGCSTPGNSEKEKKDSVYKCAEEKSFASSSGPRSTLDLLKAGLSSKVCPSLMDEVLKNESPDDIYRSTKEFGQFVAVRISQTAELVKGQYLDDNEENPLSHQLKIVSQFSEYLKEKCSSLPETDKACIAKNDFSKKMTQLKSDVNRLVQQEALEKNEQSFRESPEGLIDQACACDKFIAGHEKAIKREKEVAAVSGTANIAILNSAGSQIVDLKEIKKNVFAQYKALTGRALTSYKCSHVEELTNPLMWSSGTPVRNAN